MEHDGDTVPHDRGTMLRKTTRAKELENEMSAIGLTPDEWHVKLFGHDILDPEHDQRHGLIEDMLRQIAACTLSLGSATGIP